MKTISTHTVPAGVHQPAPREHRATYALIALLVVVAAVTVATVVASPWSGHSKSAPTRFLGRGAVVGTVHTNHAPRAAQPLKTGSVYQEQVPAAAQADALSPTGNDSNGVQGLNDDSARLSRTGNDSNGVKGLNDDSAQLSRTGSDGLNKDTSAPTVRVHGTWRAQ
jgi:hypothetical protein